jgi:hypothetical protein
MAKRAKARPNKQSAARRPPARALDFYKGTTAGLFLHVRDVDGAFERAPGAGGAVLRAPEDMFEDVPPKELAGCARAAMASMPGAAS